MANPNRDTVPPPWETMAIDQARKIAPWPTEADAEPGAVLRDALAGTATSVRRQPDQERSSK